jgi:microcystin-dependent protein
MANLKASDQASILGNFVPSGVVMPFAGGTAPAGWLLCDGTEISQTTYANLYAAISGSYNTQRNPVTGNNWAAPSGGNFRIPDYRGIFLRGTGTPFGLDAVSLGDHQADKTKKNGLAVSGGTAALTGNVGGGTASLSGNVSHNLSVNTGYANIGDDSPDHSHNIGLQISNQNVTAGGTQNIALGGSLGTGGANSRHSHGDSGHGHGLSGGVNNGSLGVSNTPANNGTLGVSNTPASIGNGDTETRPINKGVNYIIKY